MSTSFQNLKKYVNTFLLETFELKKTRYLVYKDFSYFVVIQEY